MAKDPVEELDFVAGFFPPRFIDRWPVANRPEAGIEWMGIREPSLPFLLLGAGVPARASGAGG